jgi:ubiquinone biosynthesis protein COQ9
MAKRDTAKGKKHGFYSQALDEAERLGLEEARGMEGIDEEIAILRVKLRELIVAEPERFDLHIEAANTIARLVKTRFNINKEQRKSLKEAIAKVLTEIAIPLGIKAIIR